MNARRLSSPVLWLVTFVLSVVAMGAIIAIVPPGDARATTMNILLWVATLAVVLTVITGLLALFRRIRGSTA